MHHWFFDHARHSESAWAGPDLLDTWNGSSIADLSSLSWTGIMDTIMHSQSVCEQGRIASARTIGPASQSSLIMEDMANQHVWLLILCFHTTHTILNVQKLWVFLLYPWKKHWGQMFRTFKISTKVCRLIWCRRSKHKQSTYIFYIYASFSAGFHEFNSILNGKLYRREKKTQHGWHYCISQYIILPVA